MIRHPVLLLAALLAAFLFWLPLPFGSVTPWATAVAQVVSFVALALAAVVARSLSSLRPVAVPAAALGGIALLGVLQGLVLPGAVLSHLSPEHADLYRRAAALLGEGGPRVRASLSLAPSASRATALEWAAVAACMLAAAIAGRHREARRLLAAALLCGALFEVLYGAPRWFAGAKEIWGRPVPGDFSRLRGTFVNPDHLAAYLGLALPVAFAAAWWALRRARLEPRLERRLLLAVPPVLLWLTVFAGLAFTGSRAGLLAALAAVGVQGCLLAASRRSWRAAAAGLAAASTGLATVVFLGLRQGLGRLLATSPFEVTWSARLAAYVATLALWRRFPWTGSGLGTFGEAFSLVQPEGLAGTWRHAHSDPLELLATTGVVGVVIVGAGLVWLGIRLWKVLVHGRRTEDRAAALAALGAAVALGLHECLDFGLTMPANALTLAILCGAASTIPLEVTPFSR